VLGTEIEVETVHASKKKVRINAGTQSGDQIRLIGEGLHRMGSNEKGNHFVSVKVEIPKTLNEKEKEIFEKLKQASLEKP